MTNLKVDFIIGKMTSGGAERVVANLANYFAENGHSVRIITFIEGDAYTLNKNIERIRFHNKGVIKSAIIRGFINLFKFYRYKKNRPNVISSHIGLLGFSTIPVGRFYGINTIISEHFNHKYQKVDFFKWILWNVLYKYADAITILTKFDLEFFQSRNKKVIVMENPCSFESHLNGELNKPRDKVILAIGNINRYKHKGFDNLLDIAAKVLPQHKNWNLKIVGAGKEGIELLKSKAEEYGISDQIIFTGFRNDVKDLMLNSEIFILTSRYEGLPMVLLEALSQGMACISYDCVSGPSDIITNNYNGILIENQNQMAMQIGLTNLIEDSDLRNGLRVNSSKLLDKFHINNVGKKWLELIKEISQKIA